MATFFGEVQYLSSRAYDENEEEAGTIQYDVLLDLKDEQATKIQKCNVLIVSHGIVATDFLRTAFNAEDWEEVGNITVKRQTMPSIEDTGDFHVRKPPFSHLLYNHRGILVYMAGPEVIPSTATKVTKKLLSLVEKSCNILVLSSHHYHRLHGAYAPMHDENCVIFSLQSPAFSNNTTVYPILPQPATVDSLPASILTDSIIEERPCVVYAAFTETFSTADLDLVAQPMARIFENPPFKNTIEVQLDHCTLHQYRSSNPRYETLDRYM